MNQQLYTLTANLRSTWQKHHTLLFVSLLVLLLGAAVFSLYQVLNTTFVAPADTSSSIQTFDKKTVDKIKNLHVSTDDNADILTLPTPRPNPFSE